MIAQIMEKMLAFSRGNLHDIDHLIRVWTYAKTIGELEGLDRETPLILEAAAITHDIACPLCREIYGNTNGNTNRYADGSSRNERRRFIYRSDSGHCRCCNSVRRNMCVYIRQR